MDYREAKKEDLEEIIHLFQDDELGILREIIGDPVDESYVKAFDEIRQDKNNEIWVIEADSKVVGVMQLTFIPYLSRTGTKRAQIESVRIHKNFRNKGVGREFIRFALERAREKGCGIVQLTTDKTREKVHTFYERLGFSSTHVGMKIYI
ncbi:MAG: GNAT family N-acetyltransferase [Alphaproteobacteria bacterium]|nr:GNAT family N-acetyltransferase [Alphaproteobacteria bacterium]